MARLQLCEDIYEQMRYARGYLLTSEPSPLPNAFWTQTRIANYYFYYDPRVGYAHCRRDRSYIAILGTAIDTQSWTTDLDQVANALLDSLEASEEAFFDHLDYISGRHLIIFAKNDHPCLLTDACGMRSTFYITEHECLAVASHFHLLKEVTAANPSKLLNLEWLTTYGGGYAYPGHYTPGENIYHLTPNTLLDLVTVKVRRFFPRKNLTRLSVKEATDIISIHISRLLELLSRGNKLAFSLSAGLDSRTILALSRSIADHSLYFTYFINHDLSFRREVLDIDHEIATEMAANLRLSHISIKVDGQIRDARLKKILSTNRTIPHSARLTEAYIHELPPDILHVRSNLAEIGRCFYQKHFSDIKPFNAAAMSQLYHLKPVHQIGVLELFEQFSNCVQFPDHLNYHPFDLFYWEHRMGTWLTNVLLESDVAHDTIIPFNCRAVLVPLLSVSLDDQKKGSIFHEIIRNQWPALEFWPINCKRNKTRLYDSEYDDIGQDLSNALLEGGSHHDNSRKIPISFESQGNRVRFWMEQNAPKKDDFASFIFTFKTPINLGHILMLIITSPYYNEKYAGRLEYQVILNGVLLLKEDICHFKDSNSIRILWNPDSADSTLEVRVVALRDCEPWTWGRAGRIMIERLIHRPCHHDGPLDIIATSPFSRLLPSKSFNKIFNIW